MARGGYRKPMNPAPVSGPGSLSKRTDGGPADTQAAKYVSGLPWGQGQELMNIQKSADLAATPNIEQASIPNMGFASAAATPIIPLNAPTQMPNIPVTDGADGGLGRNMSSLGLVNPTQTQYQNAYQLFQQIASNPDASPTVKYLAQRAGQVF